MLATIQTLTPTFAQALPADVPDSPTSGSIEFPQRRPAASSSEEAANAALLAQAQRNPNAGRPSGDVRLQAVLISSGLDEEAEAGIRKKFKKAALGLGQQSTDRAQDDDKRALPNKKRFSLDVLKIPFLNTRRASSNSVSSAVADAEANDSRKASANKTKPGADDGREAPATSIEETTLPIAYINEGDGAEADAHASRVTDTVSKVPLSPSEVRGRIAVPPRSAMSRPNSPHRTRAASAHRVSFSPSTGEAEEAREQALAQLAEEEERKLEQQRKVNIKRRKKEEHLLRSKSKHGVPLGLGRLRGLKSFSTGNLGDMTRVASRDSAVSDASSAPGLAEPTATEFGFTQQPTHRRFTLDKAGIRLYGVRGRGKGKAAKVKVTKKQAIAARHAKLLEQVINAGTGLFPVDAVADGRTRPDAVPHRGAKSAKPRTVPVVSPSQLKALKSALMDVDLANHIIGELRQMQIPERHDSLEHLTGTGGAASDNGHGKDRILSAVTPEQELGPSLVSRDDAEVLRASRRKSAAEDALRKFEGQWRTTEATSPKPTPRTSTPMAPLKERSSSRTAEANASTAAAPTVQAGARGDFCAMRPRKAVCLDCGEQEAHLRHTECCSKLSKEAEVKASADDPHHGTAVDAGVLAAAAAVGIVSAAAATVATNHFKAQRVAEKQQQKQEEQEQRSAATDGHDTAIATTTSVEPAHKRPHDLSRSRSSPQLLGLEEGTALLGSTPVQMVLSPGSAILGKAGQMSGAFNALADVSGAIVRATTDMDAVRPPLDRMAIFVHWWGFELTLPKPTMAYLNTVQSVSGAFLSFLQTMVVTGGVPELQPFIRYISVYMDVEFKAIKEQDCGNGVCVAATWLMPMALVPRSWDYSLEGPEAPSEPSTAASAHAVIDAAAMPPLSQDIRTGPASTPVQPRHTFRKVARADSASSSSTSTTATSSAAVAAAAGASSSMASSLTTPTRPSTAGSSPNAAPKRNMSPAQLAAIQAARTERIPTDLEPPTHSRSSSVDSRDLGGGAPAAASASMAALMAKRNSIGASLSLGLESVEEVPEGTLRIKVNNA
ncbi:hypothetical protein ACQY0O_007558 [Thecaphora frezii]